VKLQGGSLVVFDRTGVLCIQQADIVGRSKKQHKRIVYESSKKGNAGGSSPAGLRLCLFRTAALLLAPLTFLIMLELALRIAGFGYPTHFLLERKVQGKPVFVQNDDFGRRFFGNNYARTPMSFAIDQKASAETIRIFVLGESAAFGDPRPDFGLPRMLQTMLSLRYPSTHFEVVNASMTAINSHVIREIASDCAEADGDFWIVYMGNNEVVGPFGSGTVFGPQAPPLTAIRTSLAFKATRTGELLESIYAKLNPSQDGKETWGGMMMFLDQQVSASDPRMTRVYEHFQQNLEDIIECGRRAGVGLVVCNVAVNLKDCAPFSSQFQLSTDGQKKGEWQAHYYHGIELQEQGQWTAALSAYTDAESIDPLYADLHFRKGQCLLELGDEIAASFEFVRARNLDTLRFRFDSRMGEIVDAVTSQARDPQVRFADAIAAFAADSPDGIPGRDLFYEHVHLTWEGNWLLAETIAEQLDDLLPERVKNAADAMASWPSAEQCAHRLAWTDRDRAECLSEVRNRLNEPPFTLQLNLKEQIAYVETFIQRLAPALGPAGLKEARIACESALESSPDDLFLLRRLVQLRLQTNDTEGSIAAARRLTELLPHVSWTWDTLGSTLIQTDLLDEALAAYRQGLRLDPDDVWTLHHLAMACVRAGEPDLALKHWKRAVKLQPKFGTAYLNMGQALEAQGKLEEANAAYRKALQNPVNQSADLASLGRLCLKKRWYGEARKHLEHASQISPTDSVIRYDLAAALKATGRERESAEQLALARRFDDNLWISTFKTGVEHGRQGRAKEAADAFREVVRLKPDLMEGHLNLAVALLDIGAVDEATLEFKVVLQLSPDNTQALHYLEALGAAPGNMMTAGKYQ